MIASWATILPVGTAIGVGPSLSARGMILYISHYLDNPSSSLSDYTPHPTLTPRITSQLAPTRAVLYVVTAISAYQTTLQAAYARPPRNGKAPIPCYCFCFCEPPPQRT
ncbi:hypothetical protein BDP55DRAFT_197824 [Colletotrichum godetiae]|uniref:Uncharacterized protein n=1 Tax=Colletotrichum godetiae TaxID=1209918 RepID=A0AAJ0ERA8_9PEZI|nr:uncharacterized protein BDP55DRAFT_197824 [Colletotrichum godetiae]KAK1673731.1 hypothetical protein BDP55DRAFT_197824 [Colletotrichum godetiae]